MSASKPLISVIIPAYNCRDYIMQSVESILNQTYQNVEIIIADDASTDDTKEIIDSIKDLRIKRFHNNKNLGYLKTCNNLFTKAAGKFMAFQDADDYSDLRRFEIQMELLKDSSISIAGSNMIKISANNSEQERSSWPADIVKSFPLRKYYFIPNSFLFRREVYEQIGGYNEYFDRIGFEHFYWTALIIEKFKAVNVSDHLYYYRENPLSYSKSLKKRSFNFSFVSLTLLLDQRLITGTDFLEQHKEKKLKSLVHRKTASTEFGNGFRKEALKEMLSSIKYDPFNMYNYRTLFYFIRKRKFY